MSEPCCMGRASRGTAGCTCPGGAHSSWPREMGRKGLADFALSRAMGLGVTVSELKAAIERARKSD